jgi:hypothetical protein
LVLELEAIHRIQSQIEDVLSLDDVLALLLGLFLQRLMLFHSVGHDLLDVDVLREILSVELLLHDLCGTVQDDFFVLVFVKRLRVLNLASLLNDYLVKFEFDGLSFDHLLFN